MTKFQITLLVIIGLAHGLPSVAAQEKITASAQLEVTVLDQNQQPLSLAVVSVNGVATSADPSTAVMDQVDRLFVPYVLAIPQNTRVKFPNSDNIRHQVYSFSEARPFELPLYSNREAPEINFDKSGIAVLGCNIHDHMQAYIYVSPHDLSRTTDATGRVNMPRGDSQLHVWYPSLANTITDETVVTVAAGETKVTVVLPVQTQQQQPPPMSALQQRFNQRKNNN